MEIMDTSLDKFYHLAYVLVPSIPEAVIGRIAGSVVSALHYLYTLRVIHRDVKPSNILINRTGIVKLCDFVSARQATDYASLTNSNVTHVGYQRLPGQLGCNDE